MYSLNQAIHCSQVKLIFPETEFKKVQIYFLWTYHAVLLPFTEDHQVAPQHDEVADHLVLLLIKLDRVQYWPLSRSSTDSSSTQRSSLRRGLFVSNCSPHHQESYHRIQQLFRAICSNPKQTTHKEKALILNNKLI